MTWRITLRSRTQKIASSNTPRATVRGNANSDRMSDNTSLTLRPAEGQKRRTSSKETDLWPFSCDYHFARVFSEAGIVLVLETRCSRLKRAAAPFEHGSGPVSFGPWEKRAVRGTKALIRTESSGLGIDAQAHARTRFLSRHRGRDPGGTDDGCLLRPDVGHPEESGPEPRKRRRRSHDRRPSERLALGDLLRPRRGGPSAPGESG